MPGKILLIDPPGWTEGINLGLAYLNAALKKHSYETAVFCPSFDHFSDISFINQVGSFKPDVVGISVKSATLTNAQKIVSSLRKNLPSETKFIAGGPHITLLKDSFEYKEQFDLLVSGEAELSFPDVLDSRHTFPCSGINVLKSEVIKGLDSLEFPDFSGFMPQIREKLKTEYPLLTSRGCPYRCTYCTVGLISGKKWRFRSPENVIAELNSARKLYGTRRFYVFDDNFSLNVKRAKTICEMLISSGLQMEWACPNGLRADRLDRELADLMKKSGCKQVSLGIESADEEVLSRVKKGETLEKVSHAIEILKEQDIHVRGFFIIGLPGDTYDRTLKALPFIERTGLDAVFNLFVPYPGTEAGEWVQKHGIKLLDFQQGRHQLGDPRPVFETRDFSAGERLKAYKLLHTRVNKIYPFIISQSENRAKRVFMTLRLLARYDRKKLPEYIITCLRNRQGRAGGLAAGARGLLNDWACKIIINTFLWKKIFRKAAVRVSRIW